jgi:hypothetical protein
MEESQSKIFGISLNRKTLDRVILIGTIVSAIFLALIFILGFFLVYQYLGIKPVKKKIKKIKPGIGSNVGANPKLFAMDISETGSPCKRGYYGSKCDLEVHSPDFYALGIVNMEKNKGVIAKSLNECLRLCKENSKCLNVFYEDNYCQLIEEKVDPNSIKYFRHDQRNNLFTHLDHRGLDTSRRIYLLSFNIVSPPPRFWMLDKNLENLDIGEIKELSKFIPKRYIGPKNLLGLYSKFKFSKDEIEIILKKRPADSEVYLHNSENQLEIPKDWKLPIFVVYFEQHKFF